MSNLNEQAVEISTRLEERDAWRSKLIGEAFESAWSNKILPAIQAGDNPGIPFGELKDRVLLILKA